MGRLDGRVAIITGSAQGIGAAYAKAMAEEGAKIVVTDVLDTETTVNIIKQAGGEAIGVQADVTDKDAVASMVEEAISTYGKVDIMVTNAALFGTLEQKSFMDIDEDEWDRVMRVNTRGVFTCVKAVVPEMRKNGYGKIVNIASSTVQMGVPWMLHYVSSKGAVFAMTRAMARELGDDNICVNSIAPGLTMSDGIELQRDELQGNIAMSLAGRSFKRDEMPDDLVGTAVFLASSDSDFMTGQNVVVDGGMAMY